MKSVKPRVSGSRWVWLSHVLSGDTPAYGGGNGFHVTTDKNLNKGDSCNTVQLTFSNHLGSHVDAPLHFISGDVSVDTYEPEEWLFHYPLLVDYSVTEAELITCQGLDSCLPSDATNTDILFIRTGFGHYRFDKKYWSSSPGFSHELADFLLGRFPKLRAIGLDCISISSMRWREEGRHIHRTLLGMNLRIFEDLALENVAIGSTLVLVIALPLRFLNADGAPCTVIGLLN